jgi:O-antigen/teichoic acid export membrane protein
MGGALVHRAPETEDLEQAARVHFTLKLLLTSTWALLMVGGVALFSEGATRTALFVLVGTMAGLQLTETPRLILTRRVVHRRLAVIQLANAVVTTVIAVSLASVDVALWALLATDIATMTVTIFALYVWRPVWRPHLALSAPIVRYFIRFGSKTFAASLLQRGLERLADLWTRFSLGVTPLGFYSRAYTFSTYPRRVLAAPVASVIGGTYAELAGERVRLSRAFYLANSLIVRAGFFAAGLLILVAPEFIDIVLGARWRPMLQPLRYMSVYIMLSPLTTTLSSLFIAVGKPGVLVRTRAAQLGVLLLGLLGLTKWLEISGVAIAVSAMTAVGILLLLAQARDVVDFSFPKIFVPPAIALAVGIIAGRAAIALPGVLESHWRTGAVKTLVFTACYVAILMTLEGQELKETFAGVRQHLGSASEPQVPPGDDS